MGTRCGLGKDMDSPRTPFILQLQPKWSMLSEQFQDDMFDEDLEAPTHCSLDNVQNHKGSVVERLQGETAVLTGTRAEEHRSSKRATREMKQLNLRKKICWNRTWGRGWRVVVGKATVERRPFLISQPPLSSLAHLPRSFSCVHWLLLSVGHRKQSHARHEGQNIYMCVNF